MKTTRKMFLLAMPDPHSCVVNTDPQPWKQFRTKKLLECLLVYQITAMQPGLLCAVSEVVYNSVLKSFFFFPAGLYTCYRIPLRLQEAIRISAPILKSPW
jgi:hypothetical protein